MRRMLFMSRSSNDMQCTTYFLMTISVWEQLFYKRQEPLTLTKNQETTAGLFRSEKMLHNKPDKVSKLNGPWSRIACGLHQSKFFCLSFKSITLLQTKIFVIVMNLLNPCLLNGTYQLFSNKRDNDLLYDNKKRMSFQQKSFTWKERVLFICHNKVVPCVLYTFFFKLSFSIRWW